MALQQTITYPNGIQASYHRISSSSKNGNYLTIRVTSYVNSSVRDEEQVYVRFANEYADAANAHDEEKLNEIRNSVADLDTLGRNMTYPNYNLGVKTTEYKFNLLEHEQISDEVTMKELYGLLKTLPEFEDAKEV